MNLIDRYVYAVCRCLPPGQRTDIERELRGLIEDMLQERTGGRTIEEADVEAVLLELGPPFVLAGKYRGTSRHLIGPAYFEIYWLILRIVLAAVLLGITVAFAIRTAMNPQDLPWQAFGNYFGSIWSALVGAFGMTTLIFALIEHFTGGEPAGAGAGQENWKPRDLPPVPVSSLLIKKSEPIAAMIFIMIFALIINIDSSLFGIYVKTADKIEITPILSSDFSVFLPWINLSLALSFVLEIFKLMAGRWNLWLILGSIPQKVLGMVIGIRMFADTRIFNAGFFQKIDELFASSGSAITANLPEKICRWITIIVIVSFVLDMLTLAVKGIKLAFGRGEAAGG